MSLDGSLGHEQAGGDCLVPLDLINAAFVFVVLRQARERQLDRRSLVVPLVAVYFVAQRYVHSIPTKVASAEEIEQAIRALADGQTHLDPTIQQRLVAAALDAQPSPGADAQALPDDLTRREAEVLKLIAAGLSNTEIAAALVVSNATVKTHVNHIFSKTGARDRAQAVRYAYQHGIA